LKINCFTFFDYIDSLKRQKEYWDKEAIFQSSDAGQGGDIGNILYYNAQANTLAIGQELITLNQLLEC
jgi:hypothetical protein